MLQIECGISACPYGGRIEGRDSDDGDTDSPPDLLVQHHFLREYLRECGWLSIDVGDIEHLTEVWVCPICLDLLEEAKRNKEG